MYDSLILSSIIVLLIGPVACKVQNGSSFYSPENKYRPKFRYWVPDASVPSEIVARDIAAIAEAGAGGFEFLPYYQYGLPAGDSGVEPPTDWTIYGFGTEAFRKQFHAALEAAQKNDLLVDFSKGASEGQGVPAVPGTPGLAVELNYVNITLSGGETFSGVLPLSEQPPNQLTSFMHQLEDFGPQTLRFVIAAEITNQTTTTIGNSFASSTVTESTLGEVIDLTSSVGGNNSLTWTAPTGDASWRVFVWYERYTNQRSIAAGLNATNYIQNGSFVVDHFSAAGAKKLTDFFDEHVIPEAETRELLAAVGEYAWEDSMELLSSLWWTPGFQDKFKQNRGYDISSCLPLLTVATNYLFQGALPFTDTFTSENATFAEKCSEDYRTTLNEGYREHLKQYEEWAHGLGIQYSAQPAYNLPLEMLDDISLLDAPEGESLGFSNLVDTYRQFSGPAHLVGTKVISSECGAVSGAAYLQTVPDLLWSVNRGVSNGISMNVLHGYAYSGEYVNTTWPSYTTFGFNFSEMWNYHQPSWLHIKDTLEYIARNQYISQIGTPNIDLAFYQYSAPWEVEVQYQNSNLETLGYTYEYLSSANLQYPEAVVQDNVLAPDGPAYKALIFSNQTSLTPGGAASVQKFALAGLPIFFVGTTNFTSVGQKAGEAANVSATISAVLESGLGNVYEVASADDLPSALAEANILPRGSISNKNTSWYSFWRRQEDIEYAFIYNDASTAATSEVTFGGVADSIPYLFDSWTGKVTPVIQYTATAAGITIPFTLASNQTTVIAFAASNSSSPEIPKAPSVHVTNATGAISGFSYSNGSILAKLTGSASVTLSNGKTKSLSTTAPALSNLTLWDISIQDWHATSNRYSMETAIDTHNYTGKTLAPWTQLDPTLSGVSGVGTYSTTFSYPSSPRRTASLGALLHLGKITNTVRAWVNGKQLPPIDLANAVVDVTQFVQAGSNQLTVEVTTTLFNRIKADGNATTSVGDTANSQNGNYYGNNAPQEYGLVGPVFVEWVVLEKVV